MKVVTGNIFDIAEMVNFKKMAVKRTNWQNGYCIVEKIELKPRTKNGLYGFAYGTTHFPNQATKHGSISNAGTYSWMLIGVLEPTQDMEVTNITQKDIEERMRKYAERNGIKNEKIRKG